MRSRTPAPAPPTHDTRSDSANAVAVYSAARWLNVAMRTPVVWLYWCSVTRPSGVITKRRWFRESYA